MDSPYGVLSCGAQRGFEREVAMVKVPCAPAQQSSVLLATRKRSGTGPNRKLWRNREGL